MPFNWIMGIGFFLSEMMNWVDHMNHRSIFFHRPFFWEKIQSAKHRRIIVVFSKHGLVGSVGSLDHGPIFWEKIQSAKHRRIIGVFSKHGSVGSVGSLDHGPMFLGEDPISETSQDHWGLFKAWIGWISWIVGSWAHFWGEDSISETS